ncbi:MAG: efflux RND transporter periplasmic adaptor subunit [Bacteroidales bacterium]|nr:efflux RND transporter periplasmic adaptor subunit [Bacteroidales bacterium]
MRRLFLRFSVLALAITAVCSCGNRSAVGAGTEYPVMTVSLSGINMSNNYSATIQGRQDISVYPEVSGKITSVNINEGEKVRKGQVLFVIDQVPYKAALNSAQANLEAAKVAVASAQLTYDSDMKLYENNVISAYELEQSANSLATAKASLVQMEAALVTAENNLSYTEVKSPVDGVAGTIPYRVGALVSANSASPLTTVSDNSVMYVYFSLNESAALDLALTYGSVENAIKRMPDVYLKLSNGSRYEHPGRVASISGVINQSTGSVQARAEFPNPDKILMSGANGTIMFPDLYRDVILIPQEATNQLQDQYFVYKVVDGETQITHIEVNPKNDGKIFIVTDGLEVGDKIISEGAGLLRSGLKVIEKPATNLPQGIETAAEEAAEE